MHTGGYAVRKSIAGVPPVVHDLHEVSGLPYLYFPEGQERQLLCFDEAWYLPFGQPLQLDCLEADAKYPVGQS
jgi:hypothetical protein